MKHGDDARARLDRPHPGAARWHLLATSWRSNAANGMGIGEFAAKQGISPAMAIRCEQTLKMAEALANGDRETALKLASDPQSSIEAAFKATTRLGTNGEKAS